MTGIPWREVPQPFSERVKVARNNLSLEPNCYGTAFFLLGTLPYDMVILTGKGNIRRALNRMNEYESPQDKSLMTCELDGSIQHMTYIENGLNFQGYHRVGSGGEFLKVKSIKDIEKYLKSLYKWGVLPRPSYRYYRLRDNDSLGDWAKDIVSQYHFGWDG